MSYTISMAQSYHQHIIVEAKWNNKEHNEIAYKLFEGFIDAMKEKDWLYLPNIRPFAWVKGWTIPADKVELPDGSFTFSCEVYDNDNKRAQETFDSIYDYHQFAIKTLKSIYHK